MTTDPKSVVRRLIDEVINGGRLDVIDELYTPAMARGARRWIAPFRESFPDVRMEIVELIAEDEKVVGRFRCSGTHLGTWGGRPPTGRRFERGRRGLHLPRQRRPDQRGVGDRGRPLARTPARAVADGGGAQYRAAMAGTGSEEHRERARRAQLLSDRAREHAGAERAAAERSERLMAEVRDRALSDLHRRAAALHREALQQYEEAAELQQLHAEHERLAAERAEASGAGAREEAADRRDVTADERDHLADIREELSDRRDRRADEREQLQDDREQSQDERERRFEEVTGRQIPRARDQLDRAKTLLRRMEARLAREDASLDREDVRVDRDQAAIDREREATARTDPPAADRPSEESRE